MAKQHMHIKVESTLLDNFDATCKQQGLDRSETIRSLMFEFVQKYKEVNSMREKEFWQNECKCGAKMPIVEVDMAEGIFWKSCPKYMDGDDSHDSFSSSIVPANNDGLYADFYRALEIIVGSEIDYEGKAEDRDWLTNELLNVKSIGELETNIARLNTNWKKFFIGENCKEFQKWYMEFVADGGCTLLELPKNAI
jgi:hypothetical protein